MTLYNQFSLVLDKQWQSNSRLVLALSGGVDSRVLLNLLARYAKAKQIECLAVHVHHNLSDNADAWAEQCEQWCAELGVPYKLEKVTLDLNKRSVEEGAREARYHALAKHINANDLLLTGQHSDDQLETFLLALKRGSGPKGLSAMAESMAFAQGKLVRPLLSSSRIEIEAYAKSKGLQWVEDESNQDTRFDRNFVRHSITPVLKQRWPHIAQSVSRSAQLCAEQEALLDELMQNQLPTVIVSNGSLRIESLLEKSELMRARLIRMWLEQQGLRMPSRELLNKIWFEVALAQQDANPIVNLTGGQVRRFNSCLYVVKEQQDVTSWQQPIALNQACELPEQLGRLMLKASSKGGLSSQALATGVLRVQFNPEGLSAHPVGRGHSRKLKKLFQEYQIPSWQRRRIPILMCDDKVVAVVDVFIDRHFVGQDCELIWDK